jgi:hypothetical protein
MTKLQAKLIALDMWKELASDGQLGKNQTKAWNKYNVRRMKEFCPLCEIYYVHQDEVCLPECPMGHCCERSDFDLWSHGTPELKELAAKSIVKKLEAWQI